MDQIVLLIFFFIIGIVAIKLWKQRQAEQKNSNLKEIAQELGLTVEGNGCQALYNQLNQFAVFKRGTWEDIRGVLAGQKEGVDFRVISFRHGSMTGIPTEYLILHIENVNRSLPSLAFRHKKAGFLFKNGITPPEFDLYPPLKQDYALQTEDPDTAKSPLNANLLEALNLAAQNSHFLEIETARTHFLYTQRKRGEENIKIEAVKSLIQHGLQIYHQL